MLLLEDKGYYIYIYLDPRKSGNFIYTISDKVFSFDYEPFYIGKGKDNRILEHLFESYNRNINTYKCNKIRKIKKETGYDPIYFILVENLSNNEAYKLEKKFIDSIGRTKNKTGPLLNIISGGTGSSPLYISNDKKLRWREGIEKYYSNPENRKKAGYYSTIEYFISKYGIEEGTKKYNSRITKIQKSINETYKSEELRNRCKNFGEKNGFFGKKSPRAINVEINGEFFNSIYDASQQLKIPMTTLTQRLHSKKPGYVVL